MNPEHLAVVKRGAAAIAEWRAKNPDITLNLKEAHLSGADLSGADLSGARLSGADLNGADADGGAGSGHDDVVMALALAVYGAPESAPIPLGSQVLLGSSVGGMRRGV